MKFYYSLYLSNRFFVVLITIVFIYLFSFGYPWLYGIAQVLLGLICLLLTLDMLLLYLPKNGIEATRNCKEKMSNGDYNNFFIRLNNRYNFSIHAHIIDEIPPQFQLRDLSFNCSLKTQETKRLNYQLRPVIRGEYQFGNLQIFVSANLGLAIRKYSFDASKIIPVYPSYLQMRKYELLAISNRLTEAGIKKIRRLGHNMEFEQIKEYVAGDDIRTINWKATARRNSLMVNHYQDEKSQQVYSVIDKGRLMKLPFEGMSLLDYAINASLVISNIAILKQDKAGVITFNKNIDAIQPADRRHVQMQNIQEILYNQTTAFKESDFETLYINIKKKISHRSLIILYTNFETEGAMHRQLPYLKRIAFHHLLVVVFFENTELKTLIEKNAQSTEEIYLQTIAEKFAFEKKLIVKELHRFGIHSLLTSPNRLTVNTINKYLEFKSRGLI